MPKSILFTDVSRCSNSYFLKTTCFTPPAKVSISNFLSITGLYENCKTWTSVAKAKRILIRQPQTSEALISFPLQTQHFLFEAQFVPPIREIDVISAETLQHDKRLSYGIFWLRSGNLFIASNAKKIEN